MHANSNKRRSRVSTTLLQDRQATRASSLTCVSHRLQLLRSRSFLSFVLLELGELVAEGGAIAQGIDYC
jgi:hypothetical protein